MIGRREMLGAIAAAPLATSQPGWSEGEVDHILPAVSHERILVKISLKRPQAKAPLLRVDSKPHAGIRSDSAGHFWSFDVSGLTPEQTYRLELQEAGGKSLCDGWPLRTFPHPSSSTAALRVLVYTCAGGHPELPEYNSDRPAFLSLATRQAMFDNGLRQKPDAVIAIGDQVYWDLRVGWAAQRLGGSPFALKRVGSFDRAIPVLGTPNEDKLKLVVHSQIARLYGTRFRSTPVFFIQDDHDYFENDEAHPHVVTFPPDAFMLRMARATQRLYYPEYLPEGNRPLGLPGASAGDRGPGLGESFGTLRYGNLAEILLYDCRRFTSLAGPAASLVPETAEQWLMDRMRATDTAHLVNVPSLPLGWSAGKWGDWYPDVLDDNGKLGTVKRKYFWQEGWKTQHDRILTAASAMRRIPLFLCGDMHAHAHGHIVKSGAADFRRNPVVAHLTGPVSTGPTMWPSSARNTPPLASSVIEIDEKLKPVERNGFTIADFTPDSITLTSYAWKLGEPAEWLESMPMLRRAVLDRRDI